MHIDCTDDKDTEKDEWFRHDPLDPTTDRIRVVKVLPTSSSSRIECELEHVDLLSAYNCLSYVWGDSEEQGEIYINWKRFWIRQNLWNYLWRAREGGENERIWIDAICIDQSNTEERNHQVGLMSRIYRQSYLTTVWLGYSDSDITRLLLAAQGSDTNMWTGVSEPENDCWKPAWTKFIDLPYWKRVWITQEIVLSPRCRLRYGAVDTTLEGLRRLLAIAPVIDVDLIVNLLNLKRQYFESQAGLPFARLFPETTKRYCVDTRDRVYGLIGIVEGGEDLLIDYDETAHDLRHRVIEHFGSNAWSERERKRVVGALHSCLR